LDAQQQLDFIRSVFVYIQNAIDLTNKEIPPIFTKVSNNVNNIAMTIADHIIEETTLKHIKGLLAKNVDDKFIADVIEMPIKKVRDLINRIKESNQ
jgi:hypothetical protein